MLKFFRLNSIRYRMLSGFLFLTAIILAVGIVSVDTFGRVNRIANLLRLINQLEVHTLNLIKADNDFFGFESTNEKYFQTGTSRFLNRRDSLRSIVQKEMVMTLSHVEKERYPLSGHINKIDSIFNEYNIKFKELEKLVFIRGFKDYGLEGEMRLHAHALEVRPYSLEVLLLRRHEKDFLLRHDTIYCQKFTEASNKLMSILKKNSTTNPQFISHLKAYTNIFRKRVDLEKKIGLGSASGLRNDLNQLTFSFGRQFSALNEISDTLYSSLQERANVFYIIMIFGAILFSLLSGIWISKQLSEPIARLSKIADAVASDSSETGGMTLSNAAYEIEVLTNAYVTLIDQRNKQLREIKEQSVLLKSHYDEVDKLNNELDNFLYSTAHDLRSPLASLSGLVRLMKMENKQDDFKPYLDMMQGSIERQEGFISQIVNYSKNKKLDIHPELIDLKELTENIFQDNEFIAEGVHIQKFVYYKNDAPFYSDRGRVQIVFNNLISNGIRYADSNKTDQFIQVKIHTTKTEAHIEYTDNGVGIAPEHVDKIFNMFYRANLQSKGSGLGLFILKEAVIKLNGNVTVESQEQKGTTFVITLKNLIEPKAIKEPLINNDSERKQLIELTS
ncbi:MAG TPA: HAMP domain-containing sensor histidine kinase [Cyclobacteriaceae bacterium]|nr:HAMP domain-containing sensor histidine kinase [Cyclobacteriaceae bacterium]